MSVGTKKQSRQDFLDKLDDLRKPLYELLVAYQNLDEDDNEMTSNQYPFGSSYDEFFCGYIDWMNNLKAKWLNYYSPTITVGQMLDLLKDIPRDKQMTIYDKNFWFWNINEIDLPDEGNGIFTVVLHSATDFTTTQI